MELSNMEHREGTYYREDRERSTSLPLPHFPPPPPLPSPPVSPPMENRQMYPVEDLRRRYSEISRSSGPAVCGSPPMPLNQEYEEQFPQELPTNETASYGHMWVKIRFLQSVLREL